ncbi:hypothetical protein PV394_30885 [Streptomyces sp. NE06-03E]|uniref:Uncharacterized protein n=2 Tax=Streptomyces TaxID=1883 RepID=A0A652KLQ8_9ACTN|nr:MULTISPECIES: hypothetical protein [unclassified Streptomyces]WSS66082.1 hypothetical protein OG284_34985 [Streptomyces sp. NBC_01177]WSS73077.1 hypothetical protein OG491_34580 [Streptomyces sp. NBC_01175]WSS80119.1 hypothetical protein OG414_35160 [Streptomyces sp. NBC_01174]MDX3059488.1 hypothetical protein [Streptomyces sp. NE06-03E]MDX3329046.1 hypothetical protein [Streptomyces sp. ME02-6979-3A]
MHEAEITAAQAYIRLLAATRAALADPADAPLYMPLLASPIEEADEALRDAGLAGNEDRLFALVRELRPSLTGSGR